MQKEVKAAAVFWGNGAVFWEILFNDYKDPRLLGLMEILAPRN